MRNHIKQIYIAILLCCVSTISFVACAPEKYLDRSQLYIGEQTILIQNDSLQEEQEEKLSELLLLEKNKKLLGTWYAKQRRYYNMDTSFNKIPKTSFFSFLNGPKKAGNSIKTLYYERTAKPFSLLDTNKVLNKLANAELELFNQGYFNSKLDYQVYRVPKSKFNSRIRNSKITRNNLKNFTQQVEISFTIIPGKAKQFGTISFQIPKAEFIDILDIDTAKTYTNSDLGLPKQYNAQAIKLYRQSIVNQLQNNGYYDFSKDNVEVLADTFSAGKVNLTFRIAGQSSFKEYQIGKITVIDGLLGANNDTFNSDGITYIQGSKYVQHKQLRELIVLNEGRPFKAKSLILSNQRLNNIPYYRFVNSEIQKTNTDTGNYLNYTVQLNPSPTFRTTANIELSTQVGYNLLLNDNTTYFSPTISLTQRVQNIFHKAEEHTLNLGFGIGLNLSDLANRSLVGGNDFNIKYSINFPELVIPFIQPTFKKLTKLPSTLISLEYRSINRFSTQTEEDLTLSFENLNLKYGFTFFENEKKTHQIFPISLSFQLPNLDIDESFISEFQRLTLEDFILFGAEYQFTYNSSPFRRKPVQTVFRGQLENFGLVGKAISELFPSLNSFSISNAGITRYIKPELFLSSTYNFGEKHQEIAGKLLMGSAIPLGKNEIVPFLKKYTLGGVNSIRAYPIYGLGPSNIVDSISQESNISFSNVANIKFETSVEARYPVNSLLYFTSFLDAGMLWETNQSDISSIQFSDISLGTGLGVHFDFEFFIFRLDLGLPLYNANSKKNLEELYAIQRPKANSAIAAAFRLINFNFGIGEAF